MSRKHSVSVRDTKMAKAMAHPVRVQSLSILNERVASPSDIAEELGLPVANVAYHVRALLQLGCIEEVETRPVRGALEHRYRALRRALLKPDEWVSIPPNARQGMAAAIFEAAFDDAAEAMKVGVFEEKQEDQHISYTPLMLDEEGWAMFTARLDDLLGEVMEMQATCAVRLADNESGGRRVRGRLSMFAYEAPDSSGEDTGSPPHR
jgi:DNA-binding transcriptional ArsR family regulator